ARTVLRGAALGNKCRLLDKAFLSFLVHGIFFKLSIASNFVEDWSVKVTFVHKEVAHHAIKPTSAPE
ncbi:hypothetical protein AB6D06_04135, partial [Vibrio sp. 10N.239.311.G01]